MWSVNTVESNPSITEKSTDSLKTLWHWLLLLMSMEWDHVSELWPRTGLVFISLDDIRVWNHGGMILIGENRRTRRKTSVPRCPPQIPHGLTGARTLASAVRGLRLTAWTSDSGLSLHYIDNVLEIFRCRRCLVMSFPELFLLQSCCVLTWFIILF
jgi:hypothetical protein